MPDKNIIEQAMQEARINWYVQGSFECPYCEHAHDWIDEDEWYQTFQIGENKTLKEPEKFKCHGCKKEFLITGSDY